MQNMTNKEKYRYTIIKFDKSGRKRRAFENGRLRGDTRGTGERGKRKRNLPSSVPTRCVACSARCPSTRWNPTLFFGKEQRPAPLQTQRNGQRRAAWQSGSAAVAVLRFESGGIAQSMGQNALFWCVDCAHVDFVESAARVAAGCRAGMLDDGGVCRLCELLVNRPGRGLCAEGTLNACHIGAMEILAHAIRVRGSRRKWRTSTDAKNGDNCRNLF